MSYPGVSMCREGLRTQVSSLKISLSTCPAASGLRETHKEVSSQGVWTNLDPEWRAAMQVPQGRAGLILSPCRSHSRSSDSLKTHSWAHEGTVFGESAARTLMQDAGAATVRLFSSRELCLELSSPSLGHWQLLTCTLAWAMTLSSAEGCSLTLPNCPMTSKFFKPFFREILWILSFINYNTQALYHAEPEPEVLLVLGLRAEMKTFHHFQVYTNPLPANRDVSMVHSYTGLGSVCSGHIASLIPKVPFFL